MDSPTPKQRPQVVIMRVMSSSFFCMIERFEVLSAAYEKGNEKQTMREAGEDKAHSSKMREEVRE